MLTVLIVAQVVIGIIMIGLILIQQGKGADAGAAFGSGSSGTVFGSAGAGNFLSRSTAWLAVGFFAVSLGMSIIAGRSGSTDSIVEKLEAQPTVEATIVEPSAPQEDVAPAMEAAPAAPEE